MRLISVVGYSMVMFSVVRLQSIVGATSLRGMTSVFKYFAYGSNLSEKRIHINNPTAKKVSTGCLVGYRLDFDFFSKRWNGYAATIVPDEKSEVWGEIWELDNANEESLDKQEGVDTGVYTPFRVNIKTTNGTIDCKSYHLVKQPMVPYNMDNPKRLPSKIYMDTIIEGARDIALPVDYINKLIKIEHNNYNGVVYYTID